jgi:hypothetical protein
MARKAIPDATQANILLKSRRRCCLCFWLNGEDEVKKGQLAHLDEDNENAAEDNLVFLCLEHHDEYDSIPRLSKGLREQEVRRWRDELYKEMEYRFRTVKKHSCEVIVVRLVRTFEDTQYDYYCAEFRLKNTGDAEPRSPVVSFRLSNRFYARPQWDPKLRTDKVSMKDVKGDLFEPNGRIGTVALAPILLRDHSVTFFGLSLSLGSRDIGETHPLEYRVDAEAMTPVTGVIQFRLASEEKDLTTVGYLVAEGSAVLDRTLR